MSPRRKDASVLTNPVLIGALTVLVVIVAVALAYNANTGLPFVPSYTLHVQARDAEELQKGDDVNMGGALVGIVKSITAQRTRGGEPIASINLSLYKNVEPLPRDTTFTVRLKGAIGLKYLAISRGSAAQGWADGATVPVRYSGSTVDFDQVLDMFNAPTRQGVTRTTIGFGQALAGRGYELNEAIDSFAPLLANLRPVAANLASSRTDLAGFFRGLERFSGALAPVAQTQASLFTNLDTTFRALAGVAPSLQQTIADSPPSLQATITEAPRIRPFLTDTALLLHQLRPGFATLRTSAPELADAFATGARTLPQTASLDRQLVTLSKALHSLSADAGSEAGIGRLRQTAGDLQKPLAFLTPVQSTCNYVTLFLRNFSNVLSQHTSNGAFLPFVPVGITDAPGRESEPSQKLYTGPVTASSGPVHANAYPDTASPGQPRACAAGNEKFVNGKSVIGNPPGKTSDKTEATTRTTAK